MYYEKQEQVASLEAQISSMVSEAAGLRADRDDAFKQCAEERYAFAEEIQMLRRESARLDEENAALRRQLAQANEKIAAGQAAAAAKTEDDQSANSVASALRHPITTLSGVIRHLREGTPAGGDAKRGGEQQQPERPPPKRVKEALKDIVDDLRQFNSNEIDLDALARH